MRRLTEKDRSSLTSAYLCSISTVSCITHTRVTDARSICNAVVNNSAITCYEKKKNWSKILQPFEQLCHYLEYYQTSTVTLSLRFSLIIFCHAQRSCKSFHISSKIHLMHQPFCSPCLWPSRLSRRSVSYMKGFGVS